MTPQQSAQPQQPYQPQPQQPYPQQYPPQAAGYPAPYPQQQPQRQPGYGPPPGPGAYPYPGAPPAGLVPISLDPDDFVQGGLLSDVDVLFQDLAWVAFDYNGELAAGNEALAVRATLLLLDEHGKEDPANPVTQHWTAGGNFSEVVVSADHLMIMPGATKTALTQNSNWHIFTKALGTLPGGMPKGYLRGGSLGLLRGLRAHVIRVPGPKREGLTITRRRQSANTNAEGGSSSGEILVCNRIIWAPWGGQAPAPQRRTRQQAPAPAPAQATGPVPVPQMAPPQQQWAPQQPPPPQYQAAPQAQPQMAAPQMAVPQAWPNAAPAPLPQYDEQQPQPQYQQQPQAPAPAPVYQMPAPQQAPAPQPQAPPPPQANAPAPAPPQQQQQQTNGPAGNDEAIAGTIRQVLSQAPNGMALNDLKVTMFRTFQHSVADLRNQAVARSEDPNWLASIGVQITPEGVVHL